MTTPTENIEPLHPLACLAPEGGDPAACLSQSAVEAFTNQWTQLIHMGFDVEIRGSALRVQHRDQDFDTVIQLSNDDDLGELRAVFEKLKGHFGTRRDRWFSGMFQTSPAVTVPYGALKTVIETCQKVRQANRGEEAA